GVSVMLTNEQVRAFLTEMLTHATAARNRLPVDQELPISFGLGDYPTVMADDPAEQHWQLTPPLIVPPGVEKGVIGAMVEVVTQKVPSDFIFMVCEATLAHLTAEQARQVDQQGLPTGGVRALEGALDVLMITLRLNDGRVYSAWRRVAGGRVAARSEEHTFELQSRENLVCRLLLEK